MRLDFCCCCSAGELPPPAQSEGLLLRSFRKFYAPLLLHPVTRAVVVSGAGGRLSLADLILLCLSSEGLGRLGFRSARLQTVSHDTLTRPQVGGGGEALGRAALTRWLPPQLLGFLALFGGCLYLASHISVGQGQLLVQPKVSRAP